MFYNNLKAECDKQGIKMTPLIQECGGSTGAISNWKKGASPNSDIVMKLATHLNVSTDYLLFGKENSQSEQLSDDEHKLIEIYRRLNQNGQIGVMMYVKNQADKPEYQKYTDIPKEA